MSNYPLTRTDFKLVRSVTNRIEFFVRDIDRKPTNVANTGVSPRVFKINIIDTNSDRLLITKTLTVVSLPNGLLRLTILPSEMLDWPLCRLRWSVTMTEGGADYMLWSDQGYVPYGWLEMVDGPLPLPSEPITILSSDLLNRDGFLWSTSLAGAATIGRPDGIHTFAFYLDNFTGDIIIQGSIEEQPSTEDVDWFDVQTETFSAQTGTFGATTTASLKWLRLKIDTVSGIMDSFTFRN